MIKGLILIRVYKKNPKEQKEENVDNEQLKKWTIIAKYIPESADHPQSSLLEEIMKKITHNLEVPIGSYRKYPYKYVIQDISRILRIEEEKSQEIKMETEELDEIYASNDNEVSENVDDSTETEEEQPLIETEQSKVEQDILYLIYILDSVQSSEIVNLNSREIANQLEERQNDSDQLLEYLKVIFDKKVLILDKLESVTALKTEIGKKANQYIDKQDFKTAQELMKKANNLPEKFVQNFKLGKEAKKNENFHQTERYFSACYDLAGKMEELELQEYLLLKIKEIRQRPGYKKNIQNLKKNIKSKLTKELKIPDYTRALSQLPKLIEILDKLEYDEDIEKFSELGDLVSRAKNLADQLKVLDFQIKNRNFFE
ncbi:MAG: hypothetical protein ACTSVU_02040 [Promethearchaeota archaeon]